MHVTELCQRYPKAGNIVALANENREHAPEIARICDFLCELAADLTQYLPVAPAPEPVAPVARFDPYTGQPLAPAPVAYTAPVGTPGLSQGWPQPAPPAPVTVAPVDDKADIRAAIAALMAKL